MTAMPPTKGHGYLIDWAHNYCILAEIPVLSVVVCTRPGEPFAKERYEAVDDYVEYTLDHGRTMVEVINLHEDMPQNPPDHEDFWGLWCRKLQDFTGIEKGDIVIASETYGLDLARHLECTFIPCDIYREIIDIKATKVRENPARFFDQVLPTFQHNMRKTITLFGAESTGKSTWAKRLAKGMNGYYVPEWARMYLETCGDRVTDEKMLEIARGQFSAQHAVSEMEDKPYIFQDTDLLSTIGYWRIYGKKEPDYLVEWFNQSKADLYILMRSDIPFVPDKLRYGGDKRESSDDFWRDLLTEFGCNCCSAAPSSSFLHRELFMADDINHCFHQPLIEMMNFVRT